MNNDLYYEIQRNEKELSKELQERLQKERKLIEELDKGIYNNNVICYKCKYIVVRYVNGEKTYYCRYKDKTLNRLYNNCRYYHRKPVVSKTKKLAVERWNKYLNNSYYQEHKEELSKSQLRKVNEWRSTHKTYN